MGLMGSDAAPLGVILTAGKGTRLQPLTPATPKSLVPLLNRPLAAYAIELVADLGLREIVVVVSAGDESTADRVRELAPPDVTVSIAVQHDAKGPGDAVLSVGSALDDRAVFVRAVDTVLLGSARDAARRFLDGEADAGLLLKPVADPRAFGVATLDGERVTQLEEKPEQPRSDLALVGLWMLRPPAIERLRTNPFINAKGESDLTATVGVLVSEGAPVAGWVFTGEWLDGGTLEGLLHAQSRLLAGLEPGVMPAGDGNELQGVISAAGAEAHGARLHGPVLLAAGSRVEDCLLERVVVGAGAQLRDVQLLDALVTEGARLVGGAYRNVVVTGDGIVAGPGAD